MVDREKNLERFIQAVVTTMDEVVGCLVEEDKFSSEGSREAEVFPGALYRINYYREQMRFLDVFLLFNGEVVIKGACDTKNEDVRRLSFNDSKFKSKAIMTILELIEDGSSLPIAPE